MQKNANARFGNIKEKNLKTLFNLIADNRGVSRAQLAREIGLSKPAVSTLVDELVSLGYVNMVGEVKSEQVGRNPISLEVNPDYGVYITVALNRKNAVCCVYDFSLGFLEKLILPLKYEKGCMQKLLEGIKAKSRSVSRKKTICICFALPAVCSHDLTEIKSTVLDVTPGYNLIDELRNLSVECDMILANESVVYAYAEHIYGNRHTENLIFLEVSEGVGAGIVINGNVFRGVNGSAGEFGHISIDRNGAECRCGRRGCLELAVSKTAVTEKALKEGVIASAEEGFSGIAKAVSEGSEKAGNILYDMACDLAVGIGNMIAMFDIENIVLGGGVEKLGGYFLDLVRTETDKLRIGGAVNRDVKYHINYSKLGEQAKNLGAARYYCDNILPVMQAKEKDLYFV